MPPVPSAWPILDCCDAHSTAEVGQGVISHCRKKLALVYFRRNSSITVSHFLRPAGAAAPYIAKKCAAYIAIAEQGIHRSHVGFPNFPS
jgi:hypothetical protein